MCACVRVSKCVIVHKISINTVFINRKKISLAYPYTLKKRMNFSCLGRKKMRSFYGDFFGVFEQNVIGSGKMLFLKTRARFKWMSTHKYTENLYKKFHCISIFEISIEMKQIETRNSPSTMVCCTHALCGKAIEVALAHWKNWLPLRSLTFALENCFIVLRVLLLLF